MKATIPKATVSAIWLSDLHLDKVSPVRIGRLLGQIADNQSDCVFITGDISTSRKLTEHLALLAAACAPRPIFFISGNHDYYGSSIAEVDADITSLCAKVGNLHHLDGRQIIPLTRDVCLIGHGGWADARAGFGLRTDLRSPDHRAIRDFHGLSHEQCLLRMQEMGKGSAMAIRRILPLALSRFRHVILITHIPPYAQAVRFNGKACGSLHLPHYTNVSAGRAIRGIARAFAIRGIARGFPQRRITILAGHAHSSTVTHIDSNICVRVAHARTGKPGPLEILQFT